MQAKGMELEVSLTDENAKSPNNSEDIVRHSIYFNGMSRRDLVLNKWPGTDPGAREGYVMNDEYTAKVERSDDNSPWVINSLIQYEKDGVAIEQLAGRYGVPGDIKIELFGFPSDWPGSLMQLFQSDNLTVTSLGNETKWGEEVVVVKFSFVNEPPGYLSMENAEFVFSPNKSWCLLSWEFQMPNGTQFNGKNSGFRELGSGVYLPFEQEWNTTSSSGKKYYTRKVVFESARLGSSPLHEFSLGAYGLPEISERFKKRFPWVRYLLIGGGVCVLLFAFLKMRKSS